MVRKIKQVKRDIDSADGKEREELDHTLERLRVDLNYVLVSGKVHRNIPFLNEPQMQHYPKTEKYISLFPPELRQAPVDIISTTSDDNEQRLKIRSLIQNQMQHGEISKQPENELESGSRATHYAPNHSRRNQREPVRKDDRTSSVAKHITEGDDFFGEDYSENGGEALGVLEMGDSDQNEVSLA